ncbi:hypothetical protein NLG97_g5203 [Lecanicillium saksenae]|uniref:Uncharacterized protein n=1 Tax=Lecanicillium saksenae TaxID=468837 RepID=A0ACC1QVP0_9HYPO|nr:hypothetical protein NLG97_g5203 [Lecanicillium saksenae]
MASAACRIKLIVGLDYGTTYSGKYFHRFNVDTDIVPWTKYLGAFSHSAEHSVKAPTRIAFPEENEDLSRPVWGYQVEPGMKSCALTKLLLDKSALLSDFDDCDVYDASTNDMMRLPEGMTAKDVATAYLRQMCKMFEDSKRELFGSMNLDELPVEFWLTVPASWSEAAKILTKSAAIDAGFANRPIDQVMLISEPEAAAHYTLKSSIHRLENFVQKNSGVMVCDCGGGTVDITTYEIEKLEPRLKLRELAVGIAGKCGGSFVDRNFFKLMAERFGEAFTSLDPEKIGPGSAFMDMFEQRKKDFSRSTANRRAHRIPLFLPGLKHTHHTDKFYEKRSSSILLTHEDMRALFDPVVKKIIALIDDQVSRTQGQGETPISTIVLVGGFASSPYLRESLQQWCDDSDIRLATPITGAWSAIVCGAVLRGLEGSIVREKKCRRHYGIGISRRYDPVTYPNYDTTKRSVWFDPFQRQEQLTGFMNWAIEKGAKLQADSEAAVAIRQHFAKSSLVFTRPIYSCNLDAAPSTLDNPRIEIVGHITFQLDESHVLKAEMLVQNGVTHYHIDIVYKIRLNDEAGHLVCRVEHNGIEIGRAIIKLDE